MYQLLLQNLDHEAGPDLLIKVAGNLKNPRRKYALLANHFQEVVLLAKVSVVLLVLLARTADHLTKALRIIILRISVQVQNLIKIAAEAEALGKVVAAV